MADYLAERRDLAGVVMLVDSRHGLTELDHRLLAWIAPRVASGAVRLLVLLTKADKLSRREADVSLRATTEALGAYAGEAADIGVTLFSALKRTGLEDLALTLRGWVQR